MRNFFGKRKLGGLILAALAAGAGSTPAAAATHHKQSDPAPVHKKPASPSAHPTSSSTAPKPSVDSTTTKKPAHSARGKTASRRRPKKPKGQEAPTADRINEIQEALASKGTFTATPTGKWDDATADAMRKFQSSHGLAPTGKLDALTLQKLGLGSQTAGLAAPTAPPNSVNRLRTNHLPADDPSTPEEPRN